MNINQNNTNYSTNPYQAPHQTPYKISNSPFAVPPELDGRDKNEYFHLWKELAWIPRPLVLWGGGYLIFTLFFGLLLAPLNENIREVLATPFMLAWLIGATIGTLKFNKAATQILVWYPQLGLNKKKLVQIRKVARLRVGYSYRDTFATFRYKIKPIMRNLRLPDFDFRNSFTLSRASSPPAQVNTIPAFSSREDEIAYMKHLQNGFTF
jgi:hypothetical protein